MPLGGPQSLLSSGVVTASPSHLPEPDCIKERALGGPGEALSSPGRRKPPPRTQGAYPEASTQAGPRRGASTGSTSWKSVGFAFPRNLLLDKHTPPPPQDGHSASMGVRVGGFPRSPGGQTLPRWELKGLQVTQPGLSSLLSHGGLGKAPSWAPPEQGCMLGTPTWVRLESATQSQATRSQSPVTPLRLGFLIRNTGPMDKVPAHGAPHRASLPGTWHTGGASNW